MRNDENQAPGRPKVLIVDDRPENLYVLEKLFSCLNVEVIQAQSGPEALACALNHEFFVAVIDIQMPDMDGYELVELLRSNLLTANLPVIFVSAIYSDEYHHRLAYDKGAVDFLSKPFTPEILLGKVRIFLDLYQQRQSLAQANAALHQANADKDKLFGIISHDLRAPFNVVLGFAQLLEIQAKTLTGAEVEEMARSIHAGARSAYELLENLLAWSRLQRENGLALRPKPFNLQDLVRESFDVYNQSALAKEISLTNEVQADVNINADRRMVDIVLRNLTGNAIKFTQRGGRIAIISSRNSPQNAPGMIAIGVQDTGVGMSPEALVNLFRIGAHHSTPGTENEPGSGLGLVICQEMVERHGGKIWAESEVGKGTTIWFTLQDSTLMEEMVTHEEKKADGQQTRCASDNRLCGTLS